MLSTIEQRWCDHLHQSTLPFTFTDKDGVSFNAKADLLINGNYIELKQHPLNSKTSITTCYNKLVERYINRFNQPPPSYYTHYDLSSELYLAGYRYDCLEHAWNHSAVKHSIVSSTLAEHGMNYIVVFEKHDPLIKYYNKVYTFKDYYRRKYNLTVLLERELRASMLDFGEVTTNIIH